MTREEALALYRPIRASLRSVLKEAVGVCNKSDLKRAAKALGLWVNDEIVARDEEGSVEMLCDIALFEPNQRGRRAFDEFLGERASRLGGADVELAQRMSHAFFSLFRFAGPHESGGVWLENLLDDSRRIWLMDMWRSMAAMIGSVDAPVRAPVPTARAPALAKRVNT